MNLIEIERDFKDGKITKEEYISKMHEIHAILFDYADFIVNRDIKKIEITNNTVIMESRENNIKLIADKYDERVIPIEILNFGVYEKEMDMVLKLVSECSTIIDIGANIGWYSLNMSQKNKYSNIFSFEPIPKTFEYLKSNINLNNASNVHAFNFGFSDEEKDLVFYYYKKGPGNSSLMNLSEREDVEQIICKVKKLDNFVSREGLTIDFIKCDVEGAELFVFKGGFETIKKDKPIIFTELLRKWSAKFDYHPNEVIDLLREIGYKCFTIGENSLFEFEKMDEDTIQTNFIFLNTEKHSKLIKRYLN
jgi:FkbM family methyltransferase